MTTTRVDRKDLKPPMSDVDAQALKLTDPDATPRLQGDKIPLVYEPTLVRTLRRKLALSQEGFAERYGIPIDSIRDWETYKTKPDAATETYLRVIGTAPEAIATLVASQAKAVAAE
jgi:putative transcriptional regulator